ncbi:hypothetical protein JCM18897A_07880 [Streptomyces sp. JCM 18897]
MPIAPSATTTRVARASRRASARAAAESAVRWVGDEAMRMLPECDGCRLCASGAEGARGQRSRRGRPPGRASKLRTFAGWRGGAGAGVKMSGADGPGTGVSGHGGKSPGATVVKASVRWLTVGQGR